MCEGGGSIMEQVFSPQGLIFSLHHANNGEKQQNKDARQPVRDVGGMSAYDGNAGMHAKRSGGKAGLHAKRSSVSRVWNGRSSASWANSSSTPSPLFALVR